MFLNAALAPLAASVLPFLPLFKVYNTSALLLDTNMRLFEAFGWRDDDDADVGVGGGGGCDCGGEGELADEGVESDFKDRLSTFLLSFSDSSIALILNKLLIQVLPEFTVKSFGALLGNAMSHNMDLNFSNIKYPEFLASLNSKS